MFLRGDRPLPLCCKCDDQYNLAYDHTAPLCVSWLHRDVRCPRQYTCEAEKAEKNKATTVSKQQSFEGNHRCFFELEDFGCFLCFVVFCVFFSSCFLHFGPQDWSRCPEPVLDGRKGCRHHACAENGCMGKKMPREERNYRNHSLCSKHS